MKQTYDFFKLTGLPFDPPEKSQMRVKKAISEAVSKISKQLIIETDSLNRCVCQRQIDYLEQQYELINTEGWAKAANYFSELASKRKEQECESIKYTTSLLTQNGIRSLNKRVLQSFRSKTGLSIGTLTKVLEKSGIDLIPYDFTDKLPKFPTNGERILKELEEFRATKNPNPNGSDTSGVTDLYVFAAYLMDDLGHADLYKNLSTIELKTVFDLAARKYSCHNDAFGKLCYSISSLACSFVFNSDDSRKDYEAMILYHNDALQSLFNSLKILPSGILLQKDFAEKCVKLISLFFPDYNTALSIYNKEGNLFEVPYAPQEITDSVADVYPKKNNDSSQCKKSRVYGIDLGATYSSISTVDDSGYPIVFENCEEGSSVLASAVYFPQKGNPIVGEIAKNQKEIEPDRVVQFITRNLGSSDMPAYEFDGVKYNPVAIAALILKKMKSYTEEQGYDVKDVVIACPAYFGYMERNAIKQAGTIAGLNVLSVIDEPIAAAIFYLSKEKINESKKVLVYDLGGLSLELCLMDYYIDSCNKVSLTIERIDGDDQLGGVAWDARLYDFMVKKYIFETGMDISGVDDELKATITAHIKHVKESLSSKESVSYSIAYNGERVRFSITRKEFEDLTRDLVQQTIKCIHSFLLQANCKQEDVDIAVLVGGSTQMPMIRSAVEAVFPGKIITDQSNFAISKGAAIVASACRGAEPNLSSGIKL